MRDFPKPTVIISKCLTFDRCRYNAQVIPDKFIEQLKKFIDFRPICPEVEIGLGVPREPIRIVYEKENFHLYQPATGRDVTQEMEGFTENFIKSIQDVDGFILKFGSPSCGIANVRSYYGFSKNAAAFKAPGFFGGAVLKYFIGAAIEDEGRLKNFTLREHFLTGLFTLARFRKISGSGKINELMEFHSSNKLLLMAYNQSSMREMGRIIASYPETPVEKIFKDYHSLLKTALIKAARFNSHINVLEHAMGGMKKELAADEKQYFLSLIEQYRDERIPLSVLIHILKVWAIRFDNKYLLEQSYIHPYPDELVAITDSGKGRDLK
ncbi:MAG: DUF523 and DUF1722 domain-containing protein [Acidobacteria bacterium]|nr:DUF523 and DUF1722 domain-containing protein [Acidobacteriota bacterium]